MARTIAVYAPTPPRKKDVATKKPVVGPAAFLLIVVLCLPERRPEAHRGMMGTAASSPSF